MWIFLLLITLGALGAGVFYYLKFEKNKNRILELAFLKITLPKNESELDEKKETTKDYKEFIGLMEQLLSSLKSIRSKKLKYRILGQNQISLEYIAIDNEIIFYVTVSKNLVHLVEKQINGFYPDAIIEETKEPNIFKDTVHSVSTNIYTTKDFFLPIKTYQKLESDPINTIINAFSKLDDGTNAAMQLVLVPIDDDWQYASSKASTKIMNGKSENFSLNPLKLMYNFVKIFFESSDEKDKAPETNTTSALTQERAKTVDEKGDKTGYAVNIRVIVAGNNKTILESELKNILAAFSQYSYPEFNKFGSTYRHNNEKTIRNYIFRNYKPLLFKGKMILNTEEIASLYHLPNRRYNKSGDINWQNFKIVKAPKSIPNEGLLIGTNVYRGVKKEIRMKREDRFRHFYVIGQTGTGKTSIMHVMARQDFKNNDGVGVIDPHGDLVKDLLPFIPRERASQVVLFDPSKTDRPFGLNILDAPAEDRELAAQDALDIMVKLFGNEIFGPRLQDYFRNGVLALMEYPDGGTLLEVVTIFTNKEFQKSRVEKVTNPIVKAWWTNTYASMGDREKQEIIPYFAAKFGQFITNETMRNILGQTKSSFDVSEIMQNRKILLANLSKGLLGDLNSELLGLILVSKVQMAAMRRQSIAKEDRKDFFLYIDEFQNYITPSIESILSEARKYRLSLTVGHQYLGQLEKSDALTKSSLNLKEAIFGNVGTIMSYKIGPEDGEFMAKYFQPTFSEQDLMNMDKFKAVMKLSVDNQPSAPFSVIPVNPWLETGDPIAAETIPALSSLQFGRPKEHVAKEIASKIGVSI